MLVQSSQSPLVCGSCQPAARPHPQRWIAARSWRRLRLRTRAPGPCARCGGETALLRRQRHHTYLKQRLQLTVSADPARAVKRGARLRRAQTATLGSLAQSRLTEPCGTEASPEAYARSPRLTRQHGGVQSAPYHLDLYKTNICIQAYIGIYMAQPPRLRGSPTHQPAWTH
jgi:hypothetical protein